MKIGKVFSFTNFTLSVLGHVIFLFIFFIASYFSLKPQKIIAPDRIKITEIDLRDVRIEGLETKLKNQDAGQGSISKGSEIKTENKPQPVVQTIKVNREVLNIDRTLTVSVIDALRISMTRCWQIDTTRADLEGIRAVAHLRLFPNGRVQDYWLEQESRQETDPAFGYVLETIRSAIEACQPFSMLPRGEYDNWKSVQLTFFPTNKVIE